MACGLAWGNSGEAGWLNKNPQVIVESEMSFLNFNHALYLRKKSRFRLGLFGGHRPWAVKCGVVYI